MVRGNLPDRKQKPSREGAPGGQRIGSPFPYTKWVALSVPFPYRKWVALSVPCSNVPCSKDMEELMAEVYSYLRH